tara:strand:+ start:93 stop:257 length:165 start_codon:yes stop_codon:yes gene_type:complete
MLEGLKNNFCLRVTAKMKIKKLISDAAGNIQNSYRKSVLFGLQGAHYACESLVF